MSERNRVQPRAIAPISDVKREAVRQMIAELREAVIVPASDVEHYLPIMGPIFDWYAARVAEQAAHV